MNIRTILLGCQLKKNIEHKISRIITSCGGRRGLEVKRAPGNQGVRGSNPAYSSIFRGNGNELRSILSIAESGSIAKRKKSGKRNTYTYMERRR